MQCLAIQTRWSRVSTRGRSRARPAGHSTRGGRFARIRLSPCHPATHLGHRSATEHTSTSHLTRLRAGTGRQASLQVKGEGALSVFSCGILEWADTSPDEHIATRAQRAAHCSRHCHVTAASHCALLLPAAALSPHVQGSAHHDGLRAAAVHAGELRGLRRALRQRHCGRQRVPGRGSLRRRGACLTHPSLPCPPRDVGVTTAAARPGSLLRRVSAWALVPRPQACFPGAGLARCGSKAPCRAVLPTPRLAHHTPASLAWELGCCRRAQWATRVLPAQCSLGSRVPVHAADTCCCLSSPCPGKRRV